MVGEVEKGGGKFYSNVKSPINRKERRRRPVGAGTLGIEPRLKRKKNGNGKKVESERRRSQAQELGLFVFIHHSLFR